MEGRRAPARTQRVSPRTARRLARGLLVPPLLLMAVRAEAPPAGHHLFRQTHVAANIETYVRDGLSLTPRTYNLDAPYSLFDFPAYQLLVAWLCRSFSLPALPTARAVSIACFALTLLVLDRLLERTQTPQLESSLALAFFAYAPLCVFYFSAPMLDGVALLAALVSLLAFTHWDGEPDRRDPRCFAVMAGAGAFSALVKSPVYLPALLAILWRRLRERGWRGLADPALLGFAAAIGSAVVLFKLLSNAVNGVAGFLTAAETEQYFGPALDRFRPASWVPILFGLGVLALNPLTLALAGAGIALRAPSPADRWRSLPEGLLLGSGATLLIFFSRCRVHSYYLLPFVFPLALAAAHGLGRVRARWSLAGRGQGTRWGLPVAVLGITAAWSWFGFQAMSAPLPWIASRGAWIQSLTDPRDFVVYVVAADAGSWNPEYLYFAKRDGYNLWRGRLTRNDLAALYLRHAGSYRRLFVFSADAEANARLDALWAQTVAADRRRRLYRLDRSWLWPHPPPEEQDRAPQDPRRIPI